MKEASRDFKESMAFLHREVMALKRENAAIKQELEQLRSIAVSANDAAVKQRKQATANAIIQGDRRKLQNLSDTSTDITEQELLSMFQPQDVQITSIPAPNPALLKAMIASSQTEGAFPSVGLEIEVHPTRQEKLTTAYNSMQERQAQINELRRRAALMQERAQQQRLAKDYMDRGKRMLNRSDRWLTPMDNEDF